MADENKKVLSEKQLAQVSGGVVPDFPFTDGEQVCPACGSTDVQYAYDDIGYDANYDRVDSEVWVCNCCRANFIRIATYF